MDEYISREEHEEFMRRMKDEHKRIHHRIDEEAKKSDVMMELIRSVERLATQMENMAEEQESQGERLKALENRDGDAWRKVKWYILTLVIGAVAGVLFSQIGL